MTPEGIAAGKRLADQGIPVNVTLVFSPAQAILAAEIGATYVSPFLGRLDDVGADGMKVLADICEIYEMQGYETNVLAASLRHPMHVVDAAKLGRRRGDHAVRRVHQAGQAPAHGHRAGQVRCRLEGPSGRTEEEGRSMTVDSPTIDRAELEGKLLPELQRIAQSLGVSGSQRLRKGDLIAAIVAKSGEAGAADAGASRDARGKRGLAQRRGTARR